MCNSFNFKNDILSGDDLYHYGRVFHDIERASLDKVTLGSVINVKLPREIHQLENYIIQKSYEEWDEEYLDIKSGIKKATSIISTWESCDTFNNPIDIRPICKNYFEFRNTYNKYMNGGNCDEV